MKKRYSVRVHLRYPIYLEVESRLDSDRDAVFYAVTQLMLGNNRETSVYESVNRAADPDIILNKDGSVRFPQAVRRRVYPRLKVPYSKDLVEFAALVDPAKLKGYLKHLGWTFEPWGDDGLEVGRFGDIVCQVPTYSHWTDYAESVARIPEYLAESDPVEALRLAAWIAREYHHAMYERWRAVDL